MRIAIDARTLMDRNKSGIPEYTFRLLDHLFRIDRKNEYFLFYNSARDPSGVAPVFDYPNVQAARFRYPNKLLNYGLFKFLNFPKIDRKFADIDLFFLPHLNFIALSDRPAKILTVHDLSFMRYPKFFSSRKNFWHRMINPKKLVAAADIIVAVSNHTKKDIIELLGAEEKKIRVIYSGVGGEYAPFAPGDERLIRTRAKYRLPEKFFFFLGTLEPRKNIEGIIRAYEILRERGLAKDYKLVFAGGWGWKCEGILRAREEAKFKEDILFLGYVDAEDKSALYNLASVFVYPSFYEGFGFPPLEAMACGLPVVAGVSSSLPEIVADAGIMADPHNPVDIARAMKEAALNPEIRPELSRKGIERAKKFGWHAAAGEYLRIFEAAEGIDLS